MSTAEHAVTVANDLTLEQMIDQAQRRLIIVAPGLSMEVAEAVAERWQLLGRDSVSITLDVDSEVCRLGYGEIKAVRLLQEAANKLHTTLNTHPGIRIGVVISDDQTLIYAPTPLNVEASPRWGPSVPLKPNAIRIGLPPAELERDLGAGPEGLKDQIMGLDAVRREQLDAVEEDLRTLPPQRVDVSRLLRVYTAHIEFVELRLMGCMVNRRTIQVPSDLVGLADEKTRKLLESKFKILDEADAGVWGEELRRIKDFIVGRFLVRLPSYGHVIRLRDKGKFELAAKTLRKMLDRARKRKCQSLQAAIDRRLAALEAALLPAVVCHPPSRWPTDLLNFDAADQLHEELAALAGTAEEMLQEAKVEVRYKGVTYETLIDPAFIAVVKNALPALGRLHEEENAAPAMPAIE